MTIKRKTASSLNDLRVDVQKILDSMSNTAEALQENLFNLSTIQPHDCYTDDEHVAELYREADKSLKAARSQMTAFKQARDKYIQFF